MRRSFLASPLLLALGLGCTDNQLDPTDLRPSFAVGCSTKPTITAVTALMNVPAGSSGNQARFAVRNNCTTTSVTWEFWATRTGQVSFVGPASPTSVVLSGGQTQTVTVPFNAASSTGAGTVVLNASWDGPPLTATSGVQKVNVTAAAPGVPFGPFSSWSGPTTLQPNTSVFSMGVTAEDSQTIVTRLNHSATIGKKVVLAITGGNHSRYKTPPDASGSFDYAKWKARVDIFNTTAIKTAVTNAFNNGTLLGFDMLDEPQADDWHNSHTKPLIDQMATYMKSIFGSQIPMGISVRADWHLSDPKYAVLDFINTQYEAGFGSVTTWRNLSFTNVRDDKVKIVFSLNVLNGGAGRNETSCPQPPTGGAGRSSGRCSMGGGTNGQIVTFGTALMGAEPGGKKGVGLTLWDYDLVYFGRSEMKTAFASVANVLNAAPRQSWLRYP